METKINLLTEKDINILLNKYSDYKDYKFLGKGGQGVVYKINNNAIKIYKEKTNKEIRILNLIKKIDNEYLIKIHDIINIHGFDIVIMDIYDGDLSNWMLEKHNDNEWINMLIQIVYSIYILQTKLKMFHADMKPKNILYKKLDKSKIIEFDINNKIYKINTNYIFVISDFGHSKTLLLNEDKKYKQIIEYNIIELTDLNEICSLYKRIVVNNIIKTYKINDLLKIGEKDKYFNEYYKTEIDKTNTELKSYPEKIKNKMVLRSLAYYLVEKKLIDLNKFKDVLPSKKIIEIMDNMYNMLYINEILKYLINI